MAADGQNVNNHMKRLKDQLSRDSFINFALGSSREDVEKWEHIIRENPKQEDLIRKSAEAIKACQFEKKTVKKPAEKDWSALKARIQQDQFIQSNEKKRNKKKIAYGIAAVFAGAILFSLGMLFTNLTKTKEVFETGIIAQRVLLTLPDGTSVTLNRDSRLSYNKNWSASKTREIWLDGEASFDVSKQKTPEGEDQKFNVYTDDFVISVIGTSFNVNTYNDDFVVLKSGIVDLKQKNRLEENPVRLLPNQLATLDKNGEIVSTDVDSEVYFAWSKETLTFKDNSIQEIMELVKERYGLKVLYEDPDVTKKRLSGQVKVNELKDLLQILEETFSLNITQTNDTLHVMKD